MLEHERILNGRWGRRPTPSHNRAPHWYAWPLWLIQPEA